MKPSFIFILPVIFLMSCGENNTSEKENTPKLPYIGQHDVDDNGDTVLHTIPSWELWTQDSVLFSSDKLKGTIHVADFFFTSCQTICPQMTSQMKTVAKHIEKLDDVKIMSFSVDPEHDTPSVLKQYGEANGVNFAKWTFLTGDESFIHELGAEGYLLNVMRDSSQQGGFLHSEYFVLVDKQGHVRGMYDGTKTTDVKKLVGDIDVLRSEE